MQFSRKLFQEKLGFFRPESTNEIKCWWFAKSFPLMNRNRHAITIENRDAWRFQRQAMHPSIHGKEKGNDRRTTNFEYKERKEKKKQISIFLWEKPSFSFLCLSNFINSVVIIPRRIHTWRRKKSSSQRADIFPLRRTRGRRKGKKILHMKMKWLLLSVVKEE